jgi:hypothetical protein
MLYPIYFPTGKGGIGVYHKKKNGEKLTFNEYYRYMTSIRWCSAMRLNEHRLQYAKEHLYSMVYGDKDIDPLNAYEWQKNFSSTDFNPIRLGGKLYQYYLVDAYVKVEQDRLDWVRMNQKTLKAESYKVLNDYIRTTADEEGKKVGKTFILPSSFKGSPRHCQQGYQDAMALVRRFGKPSLFFI